MNRSRAAGAITRRTSWLPWSSRRPPAKRHVWTCGQRHRGGCGSCTGTKPSLVSVSRGSTSSDGRSRSSSSATREPLRAPNGDDAGAWSDSSGSSRCGASHSSSSNREGGHEMTATGRCSMLFDDEESAFRCDTSTSAGSMNHWSHWLILLAVRTWRASTTSSTAPLSAWGERPWTAQNPGPALAAGFSGAHFRPSNTRSTYQFYESSAGHVK